MTQNHLAQYNVEELQGYFSDFHKDRYGWRPRFATTEQWRDRSWLEEQINYIHDEMDHMKTTFAGRKELRRQGWIIDEADFDDIVDPKEYAAWSDYLDAEAYGEMQ
jgi:hypothetical protein